MFLIGIIRTTARPLDREAILNETGRAELNLMVSHCAKIFDLASRF